MNSRVQATRPDPGLGYRWATRRELAVDALLGVRDLLFAWLVGAVAGTAVFATVAWVMPAVFVAGSLAVSELTVGDNGSAPSGVVLAVEGMMPWVGLVFGLVVAVRVMLTVARRMPLRGAPLRRDPESNQ